MTRFFTDDIQRLSNETGLSRDEAILLLRRAGGDYRNALRMHQEAFTVYIEPDSVADDPFPIKSRVLRLLSGLPAAIRRLARSASLRRTLLLAAVMLALVCAPHLVPCALLVCLLIRIGRKNAASAQSAA